ncbi:MAG: tRNA pseudouridine(38-40) synthase TruA [Chloroflexi bacterium]|nr:tRNA pseudouridine(38-40) synthase TruA [Chloroflexota bacterium]
MKLRATIEYDGSAYFGFQVQAGHPTIQGTLEAALQRVTGEAIRVTGAGRTDTGVHAEGQVTSFRTATRLGPDTLARALNATLPADIGVLAVERAPEAFDARRSATSRTYRYRILNRPARSPLRRLVTHHVPQPLDLAAMAAAAGSLVGEHDFAAFAGATGVKRRTVRWVLQASWSRADDELHFLIEANAFLPHQVRNMVGTLIDVGRGKLEQSGFQAIFAGHDRRLAGATAPAHALCLVRVAYPPEALRWNGMTEGEQ